ncbi:hypothetical protein BJV82DRAFT_598922 [Fennellomyces sp. T-0311]|nr:hypothetical protein BJV82DRAFT_598922 [Fennellomyces sp. T-0311]
MGQTGSKSQGTLTFGHVVPTSNHNTSISTPNRSRHDLVLSKPHLYALADSACGHQCPSPPPTPTSALGRADSAYDDHDAELAKELVYIDATYYRNDDTRSHDDDDHTDAYSQRFTFLDACGGSVDKSMQEINLSARRLVNLSCNIGLLTMIRKLDLSHNKLTHLPDAIGYLDNLEQLLLSHNDLQDIPDTTSYLTKLTELDLSHNRLSDLSPCFRVVSKKLHTLHASNNHISQLSFHIVNMTHLASLDLSDNPIQVLPAEIAQLPYLRRLQLDRCPLRTDQTHAYSLRQHSPPSLLETCARAIVRHPQQHAKAVNELPDHLFGYLQTAKPCSSCHGPYFDTYVTRGQWVEKGDIMVPLEHRLCSAHWTNEDDRVLYMFSSQPLPKPSITPIPARSRRAHHRWMHSQSLLDDATESILEPGSSSSSQHQESDSASKLLSRWRSQNKKVNNHRSGFLALTKLKRPAHEKRHERLAEEDEL